MDNILGSIVGVLAGSVMVTFTGSCSRCTTTHDER